MTSTKHLAAETKPARPPLRLGLTLLHLAVMGSIGWAIIGFLVGAIGAGIGLLFLLGFVYCYGCTVCPIWHRVVGNRTDRQPLHHNAHQLTWRPRTQPGFSGWPRSLGHNLANGRMGGPRKLPAG